MGPTHLVADERATDSATRRVERDGRFLEQRLEHGRERGVGDGRLWWSDDQRILGVDVPCRLLETVVDIGEEGVTPHHLHTGEPIPHTDRLRVSRQSHAAGDTIATENERGELTKSQSTVWSG
jgi:hypothetical protein